MLDYLTGGLGIKYLFGMLGSILIYLGSTIEPQVGIWVIAMGGTFLTASFGRDRTLHGIILYICLGLGCGIFGSQLINSLFPSIPQKAIAFFAAMFGGDFTWRAISGIREVSFTLLVETIIKNFKPFNIVNGKKND